MLKNQYDIFGGSYLEEVEFAGKEEFPVCPGSDYHTDKEIRGVPFDRIKSVPDSEKKKSFLTFYVHDKRFAGFEREPTALLDVLRLFKGVIGTDNSPYRDFPLVQQKYNIYLNRKMDCFFRSNGLNLIQNVSWGDARSFRFCFDALEHGKTYAVSPYGMLKNATRRAYFMDGLCEFIHRVHPKDLIVHGGITSEMREVFDANGVHPMLMKSWRQQIAEKGSCNGAR